MRRGLAVLAAACTLAMWGCGQGGSTEQVQLPASTEVRVMVEQDLDSAKLKPGDHFKASLSEPIVLNGKTVLPQGAGVTGHIESEKKNQGVGGNASLSLVLDSIHSGGHTYNVQTDQQTFAALPVQPGVTDKSVQPDVQKRLENALITKNTIMRFLLTQPVTVAAPVGGKG